FFLFVIMSKPKPVVQQQMYGSELPGQGYTGQLPPQGGAAQFPPTEQQQLPPAPESAPPAEDDYLEGFMEEAHKQIEESSAEGSEEDNVWKPPAEGTDTRGEVQVDDLFGDIDLETRPSRGETPQKAPSPPAKKRLPDLPPPPTF
ncbi:MAG: hypothetical protein JW939_04695, partial [Candidatus Thermoplasmatota archaeon]|nr:hypothetical protein [Candidatus Thermoplasmatota archaeon]